MKKLLALLLALVMVLSLAACGPTPDPDPSTDPSTDPTPSTDPQPSEDPTEPSEDPTEPVMQDKYTIGEHYAPDNDPYIVPKYTETTTADGWILVENEGGATLGYSPDSGVSIIQVEGFAFKDLDRDGKLDVYEDWRKTNEERAMDLAAHMSGEEIAPYLTHGGWGSFGETYPEDHAYVPGGGRGGVTRNSGTSTEDAVAHAEWVNSLQALCESLDYGIPGVVSTDPNGQSGMVQAISLAATFDTDLAFELGKAYSEQLRSMGIHMLLGPQIDVASPIMRRGYETYGEDPALSRDMTEAFISGMQSTYAEDGTDLGWGTDSIIVVAKHYAAAGATEAGRDDHNYEYTVFPGNNYEAHLIPFHDGAFNLRSSTGMAAGVMMNYSASWSEDGSLGELVGGLFSEYKYDTLFGSGWSGYIISDWGPLSGGNGSWGVEDYTDAERIVMALKLGMTAAGGYSKLDAMVEAWGLLVDELGEEAALELMRDRAYENILVTMQIGLFENPYNSTEKVRELCWSAEAIQVGLESQQASIVMLKNDGTIKEAVDGEKLTVYVPYVYTAATTSRNTTTPASVGPAMDLAIVEKYFNVITDAAAEPSGTDEEGNAVYTANDIIRASADEVAACDMILAPMTAPWTVSAQDADGNWTPPSIQYGEYTATTAREESISGDIVIEEYSDGYTVLEREVKENRSYKGNTAAQASNYADLEMLQYLDSIAGDVPVVVLMNGRDTSTIIWTEVEPHADAILWSYSTSIVGSLRRYEEALVSIAAGQYEPTGLLAIGMPASMEAVEAQLEDVPRDHECYVDANGNTYAFAFGLNWSGVINDERVQTYGEAEPLTEVESFDFFYAN